MGAAVERHDLRHGVGSKCRDSSCGEHGDQGEDKPFAAVGEDFLVDRGAEGGVRVALVDVIGDPGCLETVVLYEVSWDGCRDCSGLQLLQGLNQIREQLASAGDVNLQFQVDKLKYMSGTANLRKVDMRR